MLVVACSFLNWHEAASYSCGGRGGGKVSFAPPLPLRRVLFRFIRNGTEQNAVVHRYDTLESAQGGTCKNKDDKWFWPVRCRHGRQHDQQVCSLFGKHLKSVRRANAVNLVYPLILRNIEKHHLLTNLHERAQTLAGGRAERAASSSRTTWHSRKERANLLQNGEAPGKSFWSIRNNLSQVTNPPATLHNHHSQSDISSLETVRNHSASLLDDIKDTSLSARAASDQASVPPGATVCRLQPTALKIVWLFIFIVFVQVRQLDTAHGHAQEAIARVSLNADVTQCMDGVTVCFFPQHADLVYCLLTRSAF